MRNRLLGSILAVMAVLAVSPVILAQTGAQSGAAKATPDVSGRWLKIRGTGDADPGTFRFILEDPPLQPWAMEIYKVNRKGVPNQRDQGRDELDPSSYCSPHGLTRAMAGGFYPFEIIQVPNPNRVIVLFATSSYGMRQIYMDGRGHPRGWPFGWMGHSIGKWDGDTLVVDTVGLNDKTWLEPAGTPHSDELHVVERLRRVNHDTLEIEFLFDDPKAFTKPWGAKLLYKLRPDLEILEGAVCEDQLEWIRNNLPAERITDIPETGTRQ